MGCLLQRALNSHGNTTFIVSKTVKQEMFGFRYIIGFDTKRNAPVGMRATGRAVDIAGTIYYVTVAPLSQDYGAIMCGAGNNLLVLKEWIRP